MCTIATTLEDRIPKAQRFKLWHDPNGRITLQSTRSMASFDPVLGSGLVSTSHAHPTDWEALAAYPVHFTPDFVAYCLRLLREDKPSRRM